MSSDLLPVTIGLGALVVVLFAYSTYWGLRVREVLMDRLYKTRASWVAIVASLFALLVAANVTIGLVAAANWDLSLFLFVIEFGVAVVTFAWVDTTIQVARRSDPLLRDTLHWVTLRKILWVIIAITIIGELVSVVVNTTNFFSSFGGPQGAMVYGPFGNVLALIALVVSRSRSKDVILRQHMKWFALFIAILTIGSDSHWYTSEATRLILSGLLVFGGVFLYMAARSLVPVSGKMSGVLKSLGAQVVVADSPDVNARPGPP